MEGGGVCIAGGDGLRVTGCRGNMFGGGLTRRAEVDAVESLELGGGGAPGKHPDWTGL